MRRSKRIAVVALMVALTGCLLIAWGAAVGAEPAFRIAKSPGAVSVASPDGRPLFRYMTQKPADSPLTANSACCLHPICTPSGAVVSAFAPADHRHHRGAFLGWYAIRGPKDADFWGWGQFAPTKDRAIENRSVDAAATAADATLTIANDWRAEDMVLIRERLVVRAAVQDGVNLLDLTYTLTPTADLTLDRSAFAGFCFRGRSDGRVAYTDPDGEVKLPDPHHLKPETVWPAKAWYDFSITPADGHTIGAAVVDHPANQTTGWHNHRGVWMLNPCITNAAAVSLAKEKPRTLRYLLVVHDGPAPTALLDRIGGAWRAK